MSRPDRLRIVGGAVHDPANGVDGEARDVCIEDGRIVADVPAGATTLDARGMVVMPGGVDIHSHFASSSCNHARRWRFGAVMARAQRSTVTSRTRLKVSLAARFGTTPRAPAIR